LPALTRLEFTPYVLPLLGAALVAIGVAAYTWRKRHVHASATSLSCLMSLVLLWLLAYSVETLSVALQAKELWETVITLSQAFVGPVWLIFALQYAGRGDLLSKRRILLVLLPGIITAALTLTNPWHHLVWRDLRIVASWPMPSAFPTPGPWFWVLAFYRYVYVLVGTTLVLIPLVGSPAWHRSQSLLVALGGLMPLVGNALHIFDMTHALAVDLGPFAFVAGGVLLALGLFTYRLLDVLPVAQQAIFESMREGVLVLDGFGRLVDINPAARRMLGIPPQLPVARIPLQSALPAPLYADLHSAAPASAEFEMGREETTRWLRPGFYPLMDGQGRSLGKLMVLYDITQERRLAALRDDLTHMMVHDLRNPLTIMHCSTELLLDEVYAGLEPRHQRLLKMIMSSNIQSLELVNRILDLQSLESGRMDIAQEDVCVADYVKQAVQQASLLAEVKQQEVCVDIPEGLPPAQSDPRLLQRILQNLIGNAVKFTPEGGRVTVSAREQGGGIQVTVADNGPGIPPELQQRLFRKFVTGEVKQRGSGLGLAFCKLAVEAHGGDIWMESQEGMGSAFHFTLPILRLETNTPVADPALTRQDVG